jgi:hypothetical protein
MSPLEGSIRGTEVEYSKPRSKSTLIADRKRKLQPLVLSNKPRFPSVYASANQGMGSMGDEARMLLKKQEEDEDTRRHRVPVSRWSQLWKGNAARWCEGGRGTQRRKEESKMGIRTFTSLFAHSG